MSDDKPALNDGYCRVVNAVAEGLASHPLTSIQQRVIWGVIRYTFGWNKAKDRIAASQLAEFTGLRRQQCSTALNQLIEAGVIIREGGSRSAIKINTKISDWSFEKKGTKGLIKERVNRKHELCSVNSNCGHSVNSKDGHTKDKRQTDRNTPYSLSAPSANDQQDSETPEATKPRKSRGKKPACPYTKIIDLYHEILPELPEVQNYDDPTRKSQMKARWNQVVGKNKTSCADLDFWSRYFNYIRKCPFLMGQVDPRPGQAAFRADLTWLTKSANFTKVIEGRYEEAA